VAAVRRAAVIGTGTMGPGIGAVLARAGIETALYDVSAEALERAKGAAELASGVLERLDAAQEDGGSLRFEGDLGLALEGADFVIEAVPEKLELKREVFGELDRLADDDAILATNSSSLASSRMIDKVGHPERVLNTHYQQPPRLNAVELMSCGKTDEGIIEALMVKLPQYGLVPFHVRRESDGFIFNRIWAAIKREALMVVEEGVATPEDVDGMWDIWVRPGIAPFALMDRVGLDVVLDIEEHYANVRPGIPEGPRKLLREYIGQGRLGVKSGRGFYDHST
jgi:3-hydroxybutyryl-CoA dehydrogenase